MLIKRKSFIVALVSGIIISLVLVLTLAGYFMYIELKGDKFKRDYQELLHKTKASIYSKYLDISGLDARIENSGPLRGKPVLEGIITNKGKKNISDIAIKINFVDNDNAVLYEFVMRPQEPALGYAGIAQVTIPYLYSPPRSVLKPNENITFKKIMTNCPTEIFIELKEGQKPRKSFGRWSGKLMPQVVSLDF